MTRCHPASVRNLRLNPNADPLLAMRLGSFAIAAFQSLGGMFVVPTLDLPSMQRETLSSYRYLLGSEQERILVESQNILLLDEMFNLFFYVDLFTYVAQVLGTEFYKRKNSKCFCSSRK